MNNNKKYTPNWEKEITRLSLILNGNETDDTKKKSKLLEKLLTQRTDLQKEQQDKLTEIKKLETQKKQLTNIASYSREVANEETRLNTNFATHDPRMKNFLGTGTGTK